MAATVPACAKLTAAGTTAADYLKAYYDWIVANPGNFTVSNVVGAPNVTSFTLTHSDGWQLNYRISASTILALIAPNGGVSNSATPGSPSGAQPEDTILPSPSGTSTTLHVARYADAVLVGVNATANTHWTYAWHHGRIALPTDASDAALGADGLGTLAYIPSSVIGTSSQYIWFNTGANATDRKSYLRLGSASWGSPGALRDYGTTPTTARTNKRFPAVQLVVSDSGAPNTNSMDAGALKYVRGDGGASLAPFTVVPSSGSNQAWMAINNANSNTRFRVLWNKTVTP